MSKANEETNRVERLVMFIETLPDSKDVLYKDAGEWWATNEWLCGSFAGRGFASCTKNGAVSQLIEYFDGHVGHDSVVGKCVTDSRWPNLDSVKKYIIAEYYEEAEEI